MPAKTKSRKGIRDPKAARPHMPGYGVPRDHKGLLPWEWAQRRLTQSHNYWLITTRPDGAPHAMPVWGVWVESVFCFSTGRESRKARNLAANAHCVVCNELSKEAVIVEGVAREVTNPDQIKAEEVRDRGDEVEVWKIATSRQVLAISSSVCLHERGRGAIFNAADGL